MRTEVIYWDVPPGAQEKLVVSATEGNAISTPQTLADGGQDAPWATLEPFGWPLDGTRTVMPGSPRVGFWSRETDLTTPPLITLRLPERCSATGITFYFAPAVGQWCSRMLVQWYQGGNLLCQEEVFPDSPRWVLYRTVEGFDRVEVRLLETSLAGHFAKLQQILLGQVRTFTQQELKKVTLVNEADPTLSQLTADTMTVEIRDAKNQPLLPQKDQWLELYRDGRLLAAHTIVKSRRQGKQQYSFTCQSLIGQLEDTFLGGLYDDAPVTQVLDEILGDIPYELDCGGIEGTVTGYLPVCSRREALQQVAFAAGAVISTRGTRGIRLTGLPRQISGKFPAAKVFQGGKMDISARIGKLEIVAHDYTPSGEVLTLIKNQPVSGEDILFTFKEPCSEYEIQGGTLLQTGVNHVRISADGPVTLTGKTYRHSTLRHSRVFGNGGNRDQIRSVENATLIHSGNVRTVMERLHRAYSCQHTLELMTVMDGQYAGQRVAVMDPWGGRFQGHITAVQSDLTAVGHTARITVTGDRSEPETALYYAGQLYAGEIEEVGL